jgi:hypothetical protein
MYVTNSYIAAFGAQVYRNANATTIYSGDSTVLFFSSYINAAPPGPITLPIDEGYDFVLSNTLLVLADTTFNESSVSFYNENEIDVYWALTGYVQTKNEFPVEGADVTFTNFNPVEFGIINAQRRDVSINSMPSKEPLVTNDTSLTLTTNDEGYTVPVLVISKNISYDGSNNITTEYNTTVDAVKGDYSDTALLSPTESQTVTLTLPYNKATGAVGGGSGGYTPPGTTTNLGAFTGTNNQQMGKGDTLGFTWGGAGHSIKLTTLGTTFVSLLISSEPQTVQVDVGETKEVDIDGDGTMDMTITLSKIEGGKAYLTFTPITPGGDMTIDQPAGEQPAGDQPAGETAQTGEAPSNVWMIAVVIVVLAVLGLYMMKGNKIKKK